MPLVTADSDLKPWQLAQLLRARFFSPSDDSSRDHAAFDADLIGIDPDYRVHVSGHLLEQRDGPMLEALKQIQGSVLHLPKRAGDRPDRDRLALRFQRFKAAA